MHSRDSKLAEVYVKEIGKVVGHLGSDFKGKYVDDVKTLCEKLEVNYLKYGRDDI